MSVNRRAFMLSGGAAAAAVAASSLTRSAHAQVSPSPIYGTSATVAHLTTGNTIVQPTTSANNWSAYRNTIISIATDWQNNHYDAQLAAHYAVLTPGNCKSSNLNQSQILSSIQVMYPSVTLAQLQAGWAITDSIVSYRAQSVISTLQSQGLVPYLTAAMQAAARFQQAAATATASTNPAALGVQPDLMPPPLPPGGGGSACTENVAFANDVIGLAFLTIGIMTGVGAIAEGAAWGLIAAWGGGSSTVFNIGQHIFC